MGGRSKLRRCSRYLLLPTLIALVIVATAGIGYCVYVPNGNFPNVTLPPYLVANPNSTTVGQGIVVTGHLFNNTAGTATVSWGDGTTSTPTIVSGAFTVTHKYVAIGQYTVTADDSRGDHAVTTVTIKPVKAVLSVSPNPVTRGDYVTFKGENFAPNSRIILFCGATIVTKGGFPNDMGSGDGFSLAVATGYAGTFPVNAYDENNVLLATTSLTVNPAPAPSLTVSPNPAQVNSAVTITGSNFWDLSDSTVYIDYGDGTHANSKVGVVGGAQFTHIYAAPGTYTITAKDSGSNVLAPQITVTVNPGPSPSPSPGPTPGSSPGVTPVTTSTITTPTPTSSPVSPAAQPVSSGLTGGNGWQGSGQLSAGNTSGAPDTIPPVTTVNLTGIKDSGGAYTSTVVCTLTAADNEGGSGVNFTEYSLDGSNWTTYVGSFTVARPGSTTVFYRSVDNAGNREIAKAEAVVIGGSSAIPAAPKSSSCLPALVVPLLVTGVLVISRVQRKK